MAISTDSAKKQKVSRLGAPAQHAQSSRKGKKAWRKNVDLEDVEEQLESMRTEERVTGSFHKDKVNDELFSVDVVGDEDIRKRIRPKFDKSQLSYNKILAQRSAVPAVFSRNADAPVKRPVLSYEEKTRLLRMAKRKRRGVLNSELDPTTFGEGSSILETTEAVKKSGTYDVWTTVEKGVKGVEFNQETADFLLPYVKKATIKAPVTDDVRSAISLAAVPEPHQGTSYNPDLVSHQELLRTAHEIEEQRQREAQKVEGLKESMDAARRVKVIMAEEGLAFGMQIGLVESDDEEPETDLTDLRLAPKPSVRKTKQQRAKELKRLAEKRALDERKRERLLLNSVNAARSLRSSLRRTERERQASLATRRLKAQMKLKQGLSGQRLGKHKVPEAGIDVQLGEDLSESLRAMKPEGNLFRDRFLSMQHRALIEPRVPVLPKRRRTKVKEYEKHPWKRFDREN